MTQPSAYLTRILVFLVIVIGVIAVLHQAIIRAFMTNPALNGLIVGVLLIGIVYVLRQVLLLRPAVRWVETFRRNEPGLSTQSPPPMMSPLATMLQEKKGRVSLSALSMRSLLDSIAARLDESREMSRYLIGLLVFLGLLGTFWGLLTTVSSVGNTIGALDTSGGESVMLFDQLKEGLAGPLSGMGIAFSSSLFGLAGSLILGFLDLQAGHAQSRFYNELEDWLANVTELQTTDPGDSVPPQLRYALMDMQRSISDLGDRVGQGGQTEAAVQDLAQGVDKLIRQMRAEQKVVREWADEQAQQQQEIATVLRQVAAKPKAPTGQ